MVVFNSANVAMISFWFSSSASNLARLVFGFASRSMVVWEVLESPLLLNDLNESTKMLGSRAWVLNNASGLDQTSADLDWTLHRTPSERSDSDCPRSPNVILSSPVAQ